MYKAEVKFYDPDHEEEAEFATWQEASDWLRQQRRYGLCNMWVNGDRVRLHRGELVNDEPESDGQAASNACLVIENLVQAQIDAQRLFGRDA